MTTPHGFLMDIPDKSGLCLGMPAGFESPCGQITTPHGPHPIRITPADPDRSEGTADAAVHASQAASDLFDQIQPTAGELNYLAGWLMSSAPAALTDALHAVVARRIQQSKEKS
jgi:hypothetical protein